MKFEPKDIIETCSKQYDNWRAEALSAKNPEDMKRFMDKAFFWMELQSNMLILWTVERTMGTDPAVMGRVEQAQKNINKKISTYASEILK